ncbi:MAG: phytanoyl-CoA dioxygenase family protein [Pseudomonadota bacterium]
MSTSPGARHPLLIGENAARDDIAQAWEQDNQAWWDWYVSLAEPLPSYAPSPDTGVTDVPLPDDDAAVEGPSTLAASLGRPYALSDQQVAAFRRDGYVKLPGVLTAGAAATLRREMIRLLGDAFPADAEVTAESGRFRSLELVWLQNALIRAFVLSPRIAGIASELLGVPAVRLYHDNLMNKEPGCGRTPWHHDDHHFPLATHDVVTAWIPAQAISRAMGPLAFAKPIDAWKLVRDVPFNKFDTSYDRRVGEVFREAGVEVDDSAFNLGEVSFHHNLSFHTAGANHTAHHRVVLANTYFADGARVRDDPTMVSGDWRKFMPGVEPGQLATSALNPVCWAPR